MGNFSDRCPVAGVPGATCDTSAYNATCTGPRCLGRVSCDIGPGGDSLCPGYAGYDCYWSEWQSEPLTVMCRAAAAAALVRPSET